MKELYKQYKHIIIALLIIWPVAAASFISVFCGVSPSYNGFAVDSKGILYVGKSEAIVKYKDGKEIGSGSKGLRLNDGYYFTIREDDTILLTSWAKVFVLDTDGNVLDEQDDEYSKTLNKLMKADKKGVFVASNGDKYVRRSPFLRTTICLGDKVVYRMPVNEYLVKLGMIYTVIAELIAFPILIYIEFFKKPLKKSVDGV